MMPPDEYKELKRLRAEFRAEIEHEVLRMSAELYFDIHEFSPIHWRLSKPGCRTIDVWPGSGKFWAVGSGQRGEVPQSVELYLRNEFEKYLEIR